MTDLLSFATTLATDWHDDRPGWWFVFPVLWIAVIATAIFLLRGRFGPRQHRETAIEVLDRRYAEGDVTVEEYRERRRILSEEAGD